MKTFFSILLLTAGTASFAAAPKDNPPPIRMAKLQGVLTKPWSEKQPDGSYISKSAEVCRFSPQIQVLEFQGQVGNLNLDPAATCKTDLKVGTSTVSVAAAVVLVDQYPDKFNAGQTVNLKAFFGVFWVQNDKGDYYKLGGVDVAASEDQSA